MHCERAEMTLARMVFGDLDAASEEGRELSAHLAGCRACTALLGDMRVAAKLLAEGVEAEPAPVLTPERRAALLEAAAKLRARAKDAKKAPTVIAPKRPSGPAGRRFVLHAAALAAVALVLAAVLVPNLLAARRSAGGTCPGVGTEWVAGESPSATEVYVKPGRYAVTTESGERVVNGPASAYRVARAANAKTPPYRKSATPVEGKREGGRLEAGEETPPAWGLRPERAHKIEPEVSRRKPPISLELRPPGTPPPVRPPTPPPPASQPAPETGPALVDGIEDFPMNWHRHQHVGKAGPDFPGPTFDDTVDNDGPDAFTGVVDDENQFKDMDGYDRRNATDGGSFFGGEGRLALERDLFPTTDGDGELDRDSLPAVDMKECLAYGGDKPGEEAANQEQKPGKKRGPGEYSMHEKLKESIEFAERGADLTGTRDPITRSPRPRPGPDAPRVVGEEKREPEAKLSDQFETDDDTGTATARGDENAFTDVPLGGTSVVGTIGVGGGGTAGVFGCRRGAGRKKSEETANAALRELEASKSVPQSELKKQAQAALREIEDSSVPHSELIVYPEDWKRIQARGRTGGFEEAEPAEGNQALIDRWKNELLEKERLQARHDALAGRLEAQQEAYKRQSEDLEEALGTLKTQGQSTEQAKLNREEIKRRQVAAEARVNRLKSELHAVQEQRRRDAEELAQARHVLGRLGEHVNVAEILGEPTKGPLSEPIRGKVVAVKPEGDFIALSVGMDDGVKKGQEFTISRTDESGAKFVARARVQSVAKDHCGAVILGAESKAMPKVGENALCRGFGGAPYGTYGTYEPAETIGALPGAESARLSDPLASPRARAALELIRGKKPEEAAKQPEASREEGESAPFIRLAPEQAGRAEAPQESARVKPVEPEAGAPQEPEPAAEIEAETDRGAVFKVVPVNPFVMTRDDRLSTFGIDVDTASYSIARRYIRGGYLPPVGAIRMEEFVNAFDYNYPRRTQGTFTVLSEAAPAPFGDGLVLLKVGVRGRVVGREGRKPAHLVFVVDASGSMDQLDRMPLVKYALAQLVGELAPADRVSLVAYGTKARLVLEAVGAGETARIVGAIDAIQCGGSTNLLDGLDLGYRMAARAFRTGGINRVILCSDGAANIGLTGGDQIVDAVRGFRDQGITFTGVGFGMGTYNDVLLEKLADNGDGSYVFVDSKREARRVFVEEMAATLQTIAKDVKIQVEFDPARVRRYRLVGYENRDIEDVKFRDDTVDAGEVGSGQSATALYELELHGELAGDLGTVYVRYRNIDTGEVEEISHRLERADLRKRTPETDPRFFLAACSAEFAEILRESEHASGGSLDNLRYVLEKVAVQPALRRDLRVRELLWLVRCAKGLPRAR